MWEVLDGDVCRAERGVGRAPRQRGGARSWQEGRRFEHQTRTFSTTLAGLRALAVWLAEFGVTLVGMEATGVYWRTVFDELEPRFTCWLLNAQHLRNLATARAHLRNVDGAPTIPRIDLDVEARVPDIDEGHFREHAEEAKAGCPVSRALSGVPEIELSARLV